MPERESTKWVGKSYKRKEDLRLLVGRGKFVDDIKLPNMKHAAILRSPYAHAWIRNVDTSAAEKLPGVRGVLTGADVKKMSSPFAVGVPIPPKYYSCAVDKVRFVGEPVAVVIADTRYIAEDALDLIQLSFMELSLEFMVPCWSWHHDHGLLGVRWLCSHDCHTSCRHQRLMST